MRPVMPTELADVPAWLRHQARRWSLRVLFLADELEHELDRRQTLKAVADEVGIRIVDLPRGLADDELRDFMAREIAATPAPVVAGELLGQVVNDMVRPLSVQCPHCFCPVPADGMLEHTRDQGDRAERPPTACPALWVRRGGVL